MFLTAARHLEWCGFSFLPFEDFSTKEDLTEFYNLLPDDLRNKIVEFGFTNDKVKYELYNFLLKNQFGIIVDDYIDILRCPHKDIIFLALKTINNKQLYDYFNTNKKIKLDFNKLKQ